MSLIFFMRMEAHVSLHAACQVIGLQNSLKEKEVKALYSELVQHSFEVYQSFRTNILTHAVPESDVDQACPACPKISGTLAVCIDGNFGLVRRKKAGKSAAPPSHDRRLFVDDSDVHTFVDQYKLEHGQASRSCSRFQAGDLLRSKKRGEALDIKGVFGAVCRHGFPMMLMNMFHGESLAYPVMLIQQLQSSLPDGLKLHVIYDIACQLESHLQKTGQTELLSKLQLSVPAFHAYGHIPSCQKRYNVRNITGVGLTDGEATERLWSYLRRFSTITKEMTPSGREDTLTSALLHFANRKQDKMGRMLCSAMEKAEKTQVQSEKDLSDMCTEFGISRTCVQQWTDTPTTELREMESTDGQGSTKRWQHTYCDKIIRFHEARQLLENVQSSEVTASVRKELASLNEQLLKLERKHGVSNRWTMEDEITKVFVKEVQCHAQAKVLRNTKQYAVDRVYLNELMRKYARGQAIANRLSKQMTTVTTKLKKAVQKYNEIWRKRGFPLAFEVVSNPDDTLYQSTPNRRNQEPRVPTHIMEKSVMLRQRMMRAEEEVEKTKQEMINMISWFDYQIDLFTTEMNKLNGDESKFSRGVSAYLQQKLDSIHDRRACCAVLFTRYINM